jgi:hypothetical protein
MSYVKGMFLSSIANDKQESLQHSAACWTGCGFLSKFSARISSLSYASTQTIASECTQTESSFNCFRVLHLPLIFSKAMPAVTVGISRKLLTPVVVVRKLWLSFE